MLRKSFRLLAKEDFGRVFRRGSPLFFGAFACKILANEVGHIRLGFSFSKKHIRTAVRRNYVRRSISEAFTRDFTPQIQSWGYDIVFFSMKVPTEKDFSTFASLPQSVVEYKNR